MSEATTTTSAPEWMPTDAVSLCGFGSGLYGTPNGVSPERGDGFGCGGVALGVSLAVGAGEGYGQGYGLCEWHGGGSGEEVQGGRP